MKIWKTIETVLPLIQETTLLDVNFNPTPDTAVKMFETSDICTQLDFLYDNLSFRCRTVDTMRSDFLQQYNEYLTGNVENYYRMFDALTRKYNPINNYSMTESSADGTKNSKKSTETDNQGFSGADAGTGTTENKINDYTTTLNDANTVNTSYSRIADGNIFIGQDEYAKTNYISTSENYNKSGVVEQYDNNVDLMYLTENIYGEPTEKSSLSADYSTGTEHTLTRFGNIGVTTSQQMISQELDIRLNNLRDMWVQGFVKKYCVYLGDD